MFTILLIKAKETFETQTGAQYPINKTFGGTAGQHFWTIVDPCDQQNIRRHGRPASSDNCLVSRTSMGAVEKWG